MGSNEHATILRTVPRTGVRTSSEPEPAHPGHCSDQVGFPGTSSCSDDSRTPAGPRFCGKVPERKVYEDEGPDPTAARPLTSPSRADPRAKQARSRCHLATTKRPSVELQPRLAVATWLAAHRSPFIRPDDLLPRWQHDLVAHDAKVLLADWPPVGRSLDRLKPKGLHGLHDPARTLGDAQFVRLIAAAKFGQIAPD